MVRYARTYIRSYRDNFDCIVYSLRGIRLMRGPETERSHKLRIENGFYDKYLTGMGLDIGYKGSLADAEPVLPTAIGVDMDYPGYDGIHLPFDSNSLEFVFASHCLEHIKDYSAAIEEWFRVLRVGGHLIIMVPHQYLYEKKAKLPSRWNEDHKRFYTPASLLKEVEDSLLINSYRVVHLVDNDKGFDYSVGPERHSNGAYEIELVLKKIARPEWNLK